MVAIVSFKREAIHGAVRQMYAAVALNPQNEFHFPTGRRACRRSPMRSQIETIPTPMAPMMPTCQEESASRSVAAAKPTHRRELGRST